MITSMHADILFDRPIDKEKHYISPGGYSIITNDGKQIDFDFQSWYGTIDAKNPRLLHAEMENVDTDCFPDAANLEAAVRNMKGFKEFFIYTGEYTVDGDISPIGISNVIFENDCGSKIPVSKSNLEDWIKTL